MSEKALRTALAPSVVLACPRSLGGGLSPGKRHRKAGKCDNLSFLRVRLSQMDSVQGGTNGYAPLHEGGWAACSRGVSLICSSALSAGQSFSAVRLAFGAPVNGASHRIDRGQRGVWIVAKRDVTDKIRQKVVETLRISGDDESRKGRPISGYFTFWFTSKRLTPSQSAHFRLQLTNPSAIFKVPSSAEIVRHKVGHNRDQQRPDNIDFELGDQL